jgi:hypothetical protein
VLRLIALLGLGSGCASLHAGLDVRALRGTARLIDAQASIGARAWPFTSRAGLERVTAPRVVAPVIERLPIGARTLHLEGVIEEQLVFRSQLTLRGVESNHARLYAYRRGAWGERPVLLWVPGLAVSEVALTLLRPLLVDAIDLGFDVVFFVPPYHLERSPAGVASGDAVLATDLADHLGVVAQGVADLRETLRVLRELGARHVGVFAGSLGVNLALHAAAFERAAGAPPLDFAVAMIPLVDWSALVFERPELEGLRHRLEEAGVSEALRETYGELELTRVAPPLVPERVSVIAAAWDQVTPEAPRIRWQRAWGVTDVTVLERGHGTVLLGGALREAARQALVRARSP